MANKPNENFDIVVLKFADSKLPSFEERANKDYILCGEKNDYPEYLIYQYNKCAKHRAIINGKTKYILGDGLEGAGGWAPQEADGIVKQADPINSDGETMFDVLGKSIKDIEIHGGFRWFVTVDKTGKPADIKHVDFYKLRTAKPKDVIDPKTQKKVGEEGQGYWYKEKWINQRGFENHKEEATFYPEYTGKAKDGEKFLGTYIFAYNEYGPGTDYYPLPEHVGCANAIDTDIEISKFHLSAIRNGMTPSKMIQFFNGEPSEEKKRQIEKRFTEKFAGSENAGRLVLVFNNSKDKEAEITDLSAGESDKMFDLLGKTMQQEIFTGHQVVSPMLFGIKTEGQLGGATELRIAYEVFINTYAKPKQTSLEKVVNAFGAAMGKGSSYKFKQLDPVGMILDIKDFTELLPKDFILEKLGVPKQYLTPVLPAPTTVEPQAQAADVNDNIKNLTAKQHQQVMRIIRQHAKEQITPEVARTLLKTGYGFSEEEIIVMLGIEPEQKPLTSKELMQAEIDRTIKPNISLNFITDERILSKRVMCNVSDKTGRTIQARMSVRKVQNKIKERMAALEQEIKNVYE